MRVFTGLIGEPMINLAHRAMYLARQSSNEDVRIPALHMGAPIIRGTFFGGSP